MGPEKGGSLPSISAGTRPQAWTLCVWSWSRRSTPEDRDFNDAVKLLAASSKEEHNADSKLTKIAESKLNKEAA